MSTPDSEPIFAPGIRKITSLYLSDKLIPGLVSGPNALPKLLVNPVLDSVPPSI